MMCVMSCSAQVLSEKTDDGEYGKDKAITKETLNQLLDRKVMAVFDIQSPLSQANQ